MWPISMPRAQLQRAAAVGHGVAVAHLGGLDRAAGRPAGGEVTAGDEVDHVPAGLVGAGDPAGAADDARVEQVADAGPVGVDAASRRGRPGRCTP